MSPADDDAGGALAQYLAARAGARGVAGWQAQRLSGGAIQENWRLRLHLEGGAWHGPCDLVLRTDSPSSVATSHGRAQEFALLSAAWQAGVAVPEPLWLCEDLAVTGRPFFVMRHVAGTAAGHVLVKDGAWRGDRVRLAESLGMQLARIHSLRPPRADLHFLPPCDEPPALQAVRTLRTHLDALPQPQPALEWGLDWLARHAPDTAEQVLCHGDYRTGNYLVDEHGLTGILDWEFAGWGDALQDIGWFCAKCWRFGATRREAGGIGQREDFYRGYERLSGRALRRDQVPYWEVMAHVRWAVIALQQAQRHLSGEQPSLLLALTGHIVPELAYEVLCMTAETARAETV